MYSKEQFNWVWKDTSREGILNQFYYDHLEMEKYKNIANELEKKLMSVCETCYDNFAISEIIKWIEKLKENNK